MDYSLPGSSVHGISQARILEWVATSSSSSIQYILYYRLLQIVGIIPCAILYVSYLFYT